MPPGSELARSEVGRQVLPAFADKPGLISLVMVTTKEESYHLVRNGDEWVLAEKGSYPVTAAKMQELTEALSHMVYAEPMTRDERKFDRIGLGDPTAGGTGALLEVGDGQGNSFAKLIVGYRDGRSYVRKPDDLQAWEIGGAVMPPLQRAAAWLDLDLVKVAPGDIAGADVRPGQGPAYRVVAGPAGLSSWRRPTTGRGRDGAGAGDGGRGADAPRAGRCGAGGRDRRRHAGGRACHAAEVRRGGGRALLAREGRTAG